MPRYIWRHKETGEEREVDRRISEIDVPPEGCTTEEWTRALFMPAHTRVSYLDGQRAKTDQAYDKIKRAAHMEVEYSQAESPTERREIRKSIDKLTKVD